MEGKWIIIDKAQDCTVKLFMRCAFDHRYSELVVEGEPPEEDLKAAFEYIYAQYVDISGLYQTREFEICAYIDSLDKRIHTIKQFVELQKTFLEHFDAPFLPGFYLLKKYGHHLYWDFANPDKDAFLRKLNAITMKEARYKMELNKKVDELVDMRKKKVKGEYNPLETRKDFITMMNRLQQAKFVIVKNETTIEELALMVKDQREQVETEKAQARFKKH